jgi:hypothetical protein
VTHSRSYGAILSPRSLVSLLRRTPARPTSVAESLRGLDLFLDFRRIVESVFPAEAGAILDARSPGERREVARVEAFVRRVTSIFPIDECDSYEQVVSGIPFIRLGWGIERIESLDSRPGELMLVALCEWPYDLGPGPRVALLDALSELVPAEVLAEIPEGGVAPATLRERLAETPYLPAADFADWIFGGTDTVFLDWDDECDYEAIDWTPENVAELSAEWRRADGILDGICDLADWLEADPAARFPIIIRTALGRDPSAIHRQRRRLYACEITPAGLVEIPPDDSAVTAEGTSA